MLTASVLIVCVSVYGRVKMQESEADCSRPSSAEVKNLSIPPLVHVYLLHSLIKGRESFVSHLLP